MCIHWNISKGIYFTLCAQLWSAVDEVLHLLNVSPLIEYHKKVLPRKTQKDVNKFCVALLMYQTGITEAFAHNTYMFYQILVCTTLLWKTTAPKAKTRHFWWVTISLNCQSNDKKLQKIRCFYSHFRISEWRLLFTYYLCHGHHHYCLWYIWTYDCTHSLPYLVNVMQRPAVVAYRFESR